MKTRCLIVDDEPLAVQLVKSHLEQVARLELVATCKNALEAFEVLKSEQIDLIFLDIQMPMLTGIEFLKSLPDPPKVIFTTAYREYALEGYELDVVDYLMKPIPFNRFFKAINKYFAQLAVPESPPSKASDSSDYIYVKSNKKTYRLRFSEILYLESLKDYVRIHTPDQRVVTKEKISEFANQLPDDFLRIHRSYIVNTSAITAFSNNEVEIRDIEIPIGISYKQQVLDRLG